MKGNLPLPHLLRAFRHRNYRLFFTGQVIALNGTWMTLAALGWLLFRLTGDPLTLGMMAFFMQAPTFLLTALGGVLVDHVSRRKIILIAQAADAFIMGVLAVLTLSGNVTVTQILVSCALLGMVKAFEMPARQALVADIVGTKEDLSNAIALNSSVFHSARLIGPLIAGGFIIPFFGEGICFLIHSICYLASMRCFVLLKPNPMVPSASKKSFIGQLGEGFHYAFGYPPVRDLMVLMASLALLGMPYSTLLPVFADSILGGDSATYGLLLASGGCGAMIAAIHLASRRSVLGMGRIIGFSAIFFGVALVFFALSTHLWWSLLLLFASGLCSINVMVGANTIIQTLVANELRGRVMSLMGMVFMGALPLGSLILGKAASVYGAPLAVAVGAVGSIIAGILFLQRLPELQRIARPVYIERGILSANPER